MKFSDTRIVHYEGYSFEHARLVQGIIIFLAILGMSIIGLATGEIIAGLGAIGIVLIVYLSYSIYYFVKLRTLKSALVVALMKMITLPTSMIG